MTFVQFLIISGISTDSGESTWHAVINWWMIFIAQANTGTLVKHATQEQIDMEAALLEWKLQF